MTEQLDWLAGGLPPFDVGEQHLEPIPLDKDRLTRPEELVAQGAVFRITGNYDVSAQVLSSILKITKEYSSIGQPITRQLLSGKLGIARKEIDGAFTCATKFELVNENYQLSRLGELQLKYDPYLLNPGFLWFLHFIISSNTRIIVWSRLFNTLYYKYDSLSPRDIDPSFRDSQGMMTDKQFTWNGAKELGAILRTYANSLFKPLDLVIRTEKGSYSIITDFFDIAPLIWLASILAYRERYYIGAATLETHLITEAHFSPGRLFRQNEKTVRAALDALHNLGLLTVERNLGLDQVRFKDGVTWLGAVARYLQEGQ